MTPSKAVLITGCSTGHRPGDRTPSRRARLDRVRHGPPPRDARRAGGGRLPDARAGRHRRGLDAGRGRRGPQRGGRGRRARQQRGLQPVGRGRVGPDGAGPGAVRDERLRARPDVPARPAGDARAALGQDREPLLDGRPLHVPRRRLLPRDEVRGRGDLGRAAVRGARLRRRRHRDRAGAHPHARSAPPPCTALEAATSADGPYAEFNAAVAGATAGVYESGPLGRLGGPPEAVAAKIEQGARAAPSAGPLHGHAVGPSA